MSNESPADRLRAAAYIPVSIGVVDVLPKTAVVPFDTALEILEQAADEAKTDKAQIVLLTERIAELKHYLAQAREAGRDAVEQGIVLERQLGETRKALRRAANRLHFHCDVTTRFDDFDAHHTTDACRKAAQALAHGAEKEKEHVSL